MVVRGDRGEGGLVPQDVCEDPGRRRSRSNKASGTKF